jgi:hypothetical protein
LKMRTILLFVLIAYIFTQGSNPVPQNPQAPPAYVYCGRFYNATTINNGYTMGLTGTVLCNPGSARIARSITVGISSFYYPSIGIIYRSAAQTQRGSAGVSFQSYLIYDIALEYQEANGIPGYQPGGDTVVRFHYLYNVGRAANQSTWSPINYQTVPLPNGGTAHVMSFSLLKTGNDVGSVYFGLNVVTKEVAVPINGSTSSQLIMVPSGAKFTLDVTGITYMSANSTGIALGALHVTLGGAIYLKTPNVTTPPSTYRTVDPNNDQMVYGNTDPNDKVEGGFFSFRNKFRVYLNNQFIDHNITVVGPIALTSTPSYVTESALAGFSFNRFWFSTTTQVQQITWDPGFGASEDPAPGAANSSSKICVGIVFLISLIVLIF